MQTVSDILQGSINNIKKTRWQLSQVAQCGRVMSVDIVFDGWWISSSEWFQVFETRFFEKSDLSQVG